MGKMKKEKYRKAVFSVVYSTENKKIFYLILKRKLHWKGWEFLKGGIKFFETKKQSVKREVKEETGLKVLGIKKFDISGKYKYDKEYPDRKGFIGQSFLLYSVRIKKDKIILDNLEHSDYKWVGFEKAIEKLKWENQKKCLKIVNSSLEKSLRKK